MVKMMTGRLESTLKSSSSRADNGSIYPGGQRCFKTPVCMPPGTSFNFMVKSIFDSICTRFMLCVRFCIGIGQKTLFLPKNYGFFQVGYCVLSILRIKSEGESR